MVLSASQIAAVVTACRPLEPSQVDPFLADLTLLLPSGEVGDGQLFRWLRELQVIFCDYPTDWETCYTRETYTDVPHDYSRRTARKAAARAAAKAAARAEGEALARHCDEIPSGVLSDK